MKSKQLNEIHQALFGLSGQQGALEKLNQVHLAIYGDGNGRKGLIRDMDFLKFVTLKLPPILLVSCGVVWGVAEIMYGR